MFEQSGGSPCPRRGTAGGVEGRGPRVACGSWHRPGQLELEGGPEVCPGTVRHSPEPEQLPELPPSPRVQALHRLGFVLKRPQKRLVKAGETKLESLVAEYAALAHGAREFGAKIFLVDETHFRADAELRGKWVLKGEPALVDSSSPRRSEKASYYAAAWGRERWSGLNWRATATPGPRPLS